MQFRTVIVEDETPSRERLKSLLLEIGDIELVGEAVDGPDGVKLINIAKPDLAFLDIQLPVFSSFEIIEKIQHHPYIIFITAYDEYAIKAFEANAVDYLLKPTSLERLKQAIHRVQERLPQNQQELLSIIKTAFQKPIYQQRFSVKVGTEILFIPVEEIYFFQAEDKYIFLHTFDKKYLIEETLKFLETFLNPDSFIRIHKSVIINTNQLQRIKRTLNGQYKVQINNQKKSSFEIGRTYLAVVRERLNF
jgi:DNA-binding LytR/AlgR family response regulator